MIELIKTSDAVRLSFLRAVLKDAGIETAVLSLAAPCIQDEYDVPQAIARAAAANDALKCARTSRCREPQRFTPAPAAVRAHLAMSAAI